jgi:hypothetical protein
VGGRPQIFAMKIFFKAWFLSGAMAATAAAHAAPGLPPPVLPEGVGVNIHFTRGRERDLDLIAAAGFKFIRMDFGWAGIERRKGGYDWSAYDELTANLERRKIRPVYILDYSNRLYEEMVVSENPTDGKQRSDPAAPQHPESIAAFARWAAAAAKHFQGRGIVWEIYNEPNIGFWKPKPDVKQYTALALATCEAMRAADPGAVIVGPASSGFPWPFLESFLSSGVLNYLDAVSVHPYRSYSRGPETAAEDFLRLRSLIERYAPPARKFTPVLSGEWGYATHTKGVSLETQAAFLARQQLANVLNGVPISIWYDWKNDGTDPAEKEHNFGIVGPDLVPKPAYGAVQTLTRQLAGFRVARRLDAAGSEDFVLLMVNAAGDQKLAAWTTGKAHELALDAGLPSSEVAAVDGQGQPFELKAGGATLRLNLSSAPQYLTLKHPSRKLAAAAAWSFAGPVPTLVEAGGAAVKIPLRVTNPFREPLRVRFSLGAADRPIERRIAAGQTREETLTFSIVRRSPAQSEQTLRVEIMEADGTILSSSRESLHFYVSNSLGLSLAPAEREWRLLIENPSGSRFSGRVRSGALQESVQIAAAMPTLTLSLPLAAGETPVSATLVGEDGVAVAEPLTGHSQLLSLLTIKTHLDGDAKIGGTAAVTEEDAPGPDAPFAKAFRLDYAFEAGWKFAECKPASPLGPFAGRPRVLGLWVNGNTSGCALRARVLDTTGQCFQLAGPSLDWKGWRWVEFDLANMKKVTFWGGANDGQVHGALRITTLLLVDPVRTKAAGTLWFAGPALIF